MLYPKYLITVLAGLTGGVNAAAFNPFGTGSLQDIQDESDDLTNQSKTNNSSIDRELKRLGEEKTNSKKNYDELNEKDKESQKKREDTDKSRDNVTKATQENERKAKEEQSKLEKTKTTEEESYKTKLKDITDKFQSGASQVHGTLKSKLDGQNNKLKQALQELQEKNKQHIEKLMQNISTMTDQLFKFPEATKK